jgi:hypothetical protein
MGMRPQAALSSVSFERLSIQASRDDGAAGGHGRRGMVTNDPVDELPLCAPEMMSEYLSGGLVGDLDPIFDRGAIVDTAPDAGVTDVVL